MLGAKKENRPVFLFNFQKHAVFSKTIDNMRNLRYNIPVDAVFNTIFCRFKKKLA